MDRVRAEGGRVLVLNAGNLLFRREQLKKDRIELERARADLILAAQAVVGGDAFNVGAYDLSLGVDYLAEKSRELSLPYLSANLTDQHGKRFFPPYRVVEIDGQRVGIIGLIDPDLKLDKVPGGHKLAVADPYQAAADAVAALRTAGAQLIVVLTDMEGRALRKLGLLDLPIRLAVGSDRRNQISLPIVTQETFITHLDRGGKSVGHLEIFPASGEGSRVRGQRVADRTFVNNFVQLRLDIPDDARIGAMVAKFELFEATFQKDLLAASEDGDDGGCGKEYVGADICRDCHPGRYAGWATTGHAHAYATLVAKGKQYDEECVVCHALAYECDNGRPNLEAIEKYANVQCESCHGPGDLHARAEDGTGIAPAARAREACLQCHTAERSEKFDAAPLLSQVCRDQRGTRAP